MNLSVSICCVRDTFVSLNTLFWSHVDVCYLHCRTFQYFFVAKMHLNASNPCRLVIARLEWSALSASSLWVAPHPWSARGRLPVADAVVETTCCVWWVWVSRKKPISAKIGPRIAEMFSNYFVMLPKSQRKVKEVLRLIVLQGIDGTHAEILVVGLLWRSIARPVDIRCEEGTVRSRLCGLSCIVDEAPNLCYGAL